MLACPSAEKEIDFCQTHLMIKMNEWLAAKGRPQRLHRGCCSGFTLLWCAAKVQNRGSEYFDLLSIISTWDGSANQKDGEIEEFIQALIFAQNPRVAAHMKGMRQEDSENILKIVLGATNPIKKKEFCIHMIFTLPELESTLEKIVFAENKFIRLGSFTHALGMVYQGGKYCLYDSNYGRRGAIAINNIKDLAKGIQKRFLTVFNRDGENIPLSLDIFDVEGTQPVNYPDSVQLMETIFEERRRNAKPIRLSIENQERDLLWMVTRRGTPEQIKAVIKADPLTHAHRLAEAPGLCSIGKILRSMAFKARPEECFLALYPEYEKKLGIINAVYGNAKKLHAKMNKLRAHAQILNEISIKINRDSDGKMGLMFDGVRSMLHEQAECLKHQAYEQVAREAAEYEELMGLQTLRVQEEAKGSRINHCFAEALAEQKISPVCEEADRCLYRGP